jgi:hypothetical protein
LIGIIITRFFVQSLIGGIISTFWGWPITIQLVLRFIVLVQLIDRFRRRLLGLCSGVGFFSDGPVCLLTGKEPLFLVESVVLVPHLPPR